MIKEEEIKKLVDDLYWEYDRMSSSGQETLNKLGDMLRIEKEVENA